MQRFFGIKKTTPAPPTLSEASEHLDKRGSLLENKISSLDVELNKCREQLKYASGPSADRIKQKAMQLLRQRKMFEEQRGSLYQQQFSVDQIAFAQETAKDSKEQIKAMQGAAKSLKKEHKQMNINKVEKLQDQLEDLYYQGQYIQESLARSYGVPDEITDADLDAELNELEIDDTVPAAYLDEALKLPDLAYRPNDSSNTKVDDNCDNLEERLGLKI